MERTIAKVSEETLILQAYLRKKKIGEILDYVQIEHDTKVKMDNKGRGYLRTALKRAKLEYSPIVGKGIKLAEPGDVMGLLNNRVTKIDRAVKRGEKSHRNLQEQFFSSLNQQEQKEILYVGAVFGAIRVAAENGKLIYGKKINKIQDNQTINIPVINI